MAKKAWNKQQAKLMKEVKKKLKVLGSGKGAKLEIKRSLFENPKGLESISEVLD